MKRLYLKLHLGLKRQCDRLSPLQRKIAVFGLSLIYLCCSLGMIVRFFATSDNSYMELSCSRGGVVKLTFFQDFANLFNNNESLVSHKNSMDYNEGNFLKLLSQFYQSMT